MKLIIHYEHESEKLYSKTLKITLPKSWKNGPTSRILDQFVESYNEAITGMISSSTDSHSDLENDSPLIPPPLESSKLHLAFFKLSPDSPSQERITDEYDSQIKDEESDGFYDPIASDATVLQVLSDRDHVYVRHGPSITMEDKQKLNSSLPPKQEEGTTEEAQLVRCTNFGCKNRFPKGTMEPPKPCIHHSGPPVFHETAKFWSCCPQKKAYDWDEFESIAGCVVDEAGCTDVPKSKSTRNFLGGCDLRDAAAEKSGVKLRSIEEFNRQQQLQPQQPVEQVQENDGKDQKGGENNQFTGNNHSVLERLGHVLSEMGIEKELFEQVVDGIKKELVSSSNYTMEGNDPVSLASLVSEELGSKLKKAFKAMAVEQLRIK